MEEGNQSGELVISGGHGNAQEEYVMRRRRRKRKRKRKRTKKKNKEKEEGTNTWRRPVTLSDETVGRRQRDLP